MTSAHQSSRPELILKEKSRGSSHDQEKVRWDSRRTGSLQRTKGTNVGLRQNRGNGSGQGGATGRQGNTSGQSKANKAPDFLRQLFLESTGCQGINVPSTGISWVAKRAG